jgi:hypothetical protein
MIKKYWRDILLSVIVNFGIQATMYNLNFVSYFSGNIVLLCFHFFWTCIMYKLTNLKDYWLILISILPSIIIDSITLITGPSLIPLRFPIPTVFTIIGSLGAWLLISKFVRTSIILLLTVVCLYLRFGELSIGWITNKKITNQEVQAKNSIAIVQDKFLTVTGDTITLQEAMANKAKVIVETYFIGCAPCDAKERVLKGLGKRTDTSKYQTILICANMPTYSFEDFQKRERLIKDKNAIYLYDFQKLLETKMNIESFPYEVLISNNQIVGTIKGFDDGNELAYFYLKEKLKFLKSE